MTPPDVTPVSEALSWLAAQDTIAEAQDKRDLGWAWAHLTAEQRVAKMGERARARDAAILNAREALTRAAADGGVAGWRLVPVKPTEAMIDKYFDRCSALGYRSHINASAAWEALLSAAPPPPVAAADGGVAGWRNMDSAPKDGTEFWALTDDTSGNDLPPFVGRCAYHPDAGFCTDELREPILWRPGHFAAPPPPVAAGSDDLRAENDELDLLRRREVQAIGAAISTRNWHALENAYNQGRDRLDRILSARKKNIAL